MEFDKMLPTDRRPPVRYARTTSALVVAILWAHILLLGDPGFGSLRKKKINLPVRQPAAVRLANTSIAFTGSASSPAYARVQEALLTTLTTELLANEKTLVKKATPAEADWVLGLRITAFAVKQPEQRADTVGNNGATYTRWTGSIRAAYQVLDHAGRSHDAGNVEYNYDKEITSGAKVGKVSLSRLPLPGRKKSAADREPHTTEDVQELLVDQIARQIAEKLGNTNKTIEAEIATGDDHLNRAAEFMESRLWSRALDELDQTPPFSKPESEAYRQYDLGLAHEAIGYDAKVFKDQQKDLFEAQEYYDKALELNRKEKYFVTAVARIKDSMARYKAFEGMQREDAKQQASAAAQPIPAQNAAPSAKITQTPTSGAQTGTAKMASAAPQTPRNQVAVPAGSAGPNTGGAKQQVTIPAANAAKKQALAPAIPPDPVSKAPAASGGSPKTAPKTLKIGDVIEMFTSGVPEGQIVDIIQHSQVQFDALDKDTAIAIARARLPLTLQNELRKKVGAALLGPAKAATGK
jgi:hypothetical protein